MLVFADCGEAVCDKLLPPLTGSRHSRLRSTRFTLPSAHCRLTDAWLYLLKMARSITGLLLQVSRLVRCRSVRPDMRTVPSDSGRKSRTYRASRFARFGPAAAG